MMVATMEKPVELSIEKCKYYFRPFYTAARGRDGRLVFEPHLPSKILVVGCGGNGAYLIPLLARYLAKSPSEIVQQIELVLIDGDKVEEKNILRQNFVQMEIGMNKAAAMTDRCNMNFGMNVRAVESYLNADVLNEELRNGTQRNPYGGQNTLIMGCVDRHEVRNLISTVMERENSSNGNRTIFYIDVGNELQAGHCFLSGRLSVRLDSDGYEKRTQPLLIHNFYPTISKADVKKAAPSCADLTASGAQRMDVNVKAGTLAFESFCAVMAPGEVDYYQITFGPGHTKTFHVKDLYITPRSLIPHESKPDKGE